MRWEDIDQVAQIEREAFPALWPSTNYRRELKNRLSEFEVVVECGQPAPLLMLPPRRSLLDVLRRKTPSRPMAAPPELVVGFVGVWYSAGEGHIVSIAVREDYRRRGIGELLLLGAIEMTTRRLHQVVTLEVRISNTSAQSLYIKYGFSQVGLRKAYYSDNREDAYIMSTDTLTGPGYQELLAERMREFSERYGEAERAYLG
jgi:ribosomal-protein-alanine N-acetyltransferase